MKKKIGMVIILALLVGLFVKGRAYYEDRYVGETYYGRIGENQDMTFKTQYSSDGKPMDKAIDYKVKIYNDKEERTVNFQRYEGSDYFKPGDYIEVEASNQISLGEKLIDKKDIPSNILEKIK